MTEENKNNKNEGLERFITAQDGTRGNTTLYEMALKEIQEGNLGFECWIRYVYPQLKRKGTSQLTDFYGLDGREEAKAYSAFRSCKNLESVIFSGEESLKYIKELAFEGCEKLQYINFPINMEEIGYCAFQGCRSLHFINIRSLRKIGVKAFSQCTSLQEIDFNYSAVKTINDSAFEDCIKLTYAILPDSLIELGENVFKGCTSLHWISFPGSLEKIESVCSGCSSLRRVFLGEGIKRIDNWAFNNLPLLDNLALPNSLEEIEDFAFSNCTSLSEINIPSLVTRISDSSFCGCFSVEKILVSSDNKTYDSREGCNAIIETHTNRLIIGCKNTIIPDTVEIISEYAFAMLSNMHLIFIPASI